MVDHQRIQLDFMDSVRKIEVADMKRGAPVMERLFFLPANAVRGFQFTDRSSRRTMIRDRVSSTDLLNIS